MNTEKTADVVEMRDNKEGNGAVPETPSEPVDIIQKIIGTFGKYHVILCFFIFLSKFPVAFHQMAIIFLAPKVEYTCPDTNMETCPCPNPEYNTSLFTRTIIMEWDLICDRRWLSSFTQTLFQLGVLIGSVLFGMASDRFGRKKPLLAAVVLQVVMGIVAAYIPEFWSFTFVRFLIGMSIGGTMVIGFVIIMEFAGTDIRATLSAAYQAPFNLGHMLLPVFGYYFRDFANFQLAVSIPVILLLSYFFFVPESPRWLIAVNRTDEAVKILEKAARRNNRPTENIKAEIESYQKLMESNRQEKGTIVDLFRTPNIRKNIIAMSYNWFSCSYCFYGVSQYMGQLSGNVFINVAASASVSLLGTFIAIILMKFMGRKSMVILFNAICVACLLLLAVIPENVGSVICACIGVVCAFIVFVLVYLYCSELFPTVVRNAAVGFSSMMARVGSMIAPFVIDLRATARWMPPVAFAVFPLIAIFVTFLLPETKGRELMTTIEEGEAFGKKNSKKT